MSIIGTLFIGLIVGLVARFIKPGNDGILLPTPDLQRLITRLDPAQRARLLQR